MKVKLLKKIRKRFSIEYRPDGLYQTFGNYITGPVVLLWDKECGFLREYARVNPDWDENSCALICHTKERAINALKEKMLSLIQQEYYQYSRKYKNK